MVAPRWRELEHSDEGQLLSLVELGLRGPTLGVLQRQGILSVTQLVQMAPEELMGMRRVGLSRMLEIRQALQEHGLDLRAEGPSYQTRAWEVSRRVRLACCELGECTLEVKTAGASSTDTARLVAYFVAAHRSCPRLKGREPVVTTTEVTRPGAAGQTDGEVLSLEKQPRRA